MRQTRIGGKQEGRESQEWPVASFRKMALKRRRGEVRGRPLTPKPLTPNPSPDGRGEMERVGQRRRI